MTRKFIFPGGEKLEYLARITALTDFLRRGPLSLQEIMEFVILDTLFDYGATTAFLNIVWTDGSIHVPAWYGCSEADKDLLPDRLVTADTPVNEALRTGKIVECGSFDDYVFAGPDYPKRIFPEGFAYSLAWPIPDFGVVVSFYRKKTNLNPANELFFRSVGGILALHFSQGAYKNSFKSGRLKDELVPLVALTQRQWTILGALRRGETNAKIANDIDVSESLVRQETVRIYRNLGVSGRKELIAEKITK
jgi:DNA-binding CsgD family transcriptional regulator